MIVLLFLRHLIQSIAIASHWLYYSFLSCVKWWSRISSIATNERFKSVGFSLKRSKYYKKKLFSCLFFSALNKCGNHYAQMNEPLLLSTFIYLKYFPTSFVKNHTVKLLQEIAVNFLIAEKQWTKYLQTIPNFSWIFFSDKPSKLNNFMTAQYSNLTKHTLHIYLKRVCIRCVPMSQNKVHWLLRHLCARPRTFYCILVCIFSLKKILLPQNRNFSRPL